MSAHQHLRTATAEAHEMVDARFGRFELADGNDYAAFLMAHARVVPALESHLDDAEGPPLLRPRAPLLIADLADLGISPPDQLAVMPPATRAAAWGVAYVLEGSRLGGRMLERSVPAKWPRRYLAAGHEAGEWRRFTGGLDAALTTPEQLDEAVAAAAAVFALYGEAADRR